MDKKLRETTYLCVKIMNSKRQMYCKGETWSPGTNFVTWCLTSLIDLLSLYVLFSQYRSCDNTLENCFFQISSCSRAYVCRHKNTKCQVPLGPLLGKQTIQAKEVYTSQSSATRKPGGVTQQMFIRGRSTPRSNLLPFIYHFSRKRYPFLWGLWRDMKLSRVNANLLCVGNIAFGCFSSTSKAVFYIKHNIRNVQDDKERLETKRNCIKRSEFTFENQLFPVVLPTSSFWWELVVVQLDRTTWKRGDAQNGCAVRKIADLVLELVLVVDANIL